MLFQLHAYQDLLDVSCLPSQPSLVFLRQSEDRFLPQVLHLPASPQDRLCPVLADACPLLSIQVLISQETRLLYTYPSQNWFSHIHQLHIHVFRMLLYAQ